MTKPPEKRKFCEAFTPPPCPCANHSSQDTASAANFQLVFVSDIGLELDVSFEDKQISGSATLSLRRAPGPLLPEIPVVLDVHKTMKIHSVAVFEDGGCKAIRYEVKNFTGFGDSMHLKLPAAAFENGGVTDGDARIVIKYSTRPETPATTWLDPVQTHGKVHPYLFTQGQAVMNRSLFPCMDTPAVRFTYTCTLTVPKGLAAVMSAEVCGHEDHATGSTFRFMMPQPIPSYLVALAVGDLVSKEIGPRSKVWAERTQLEAAAWEFDGVPEKYLASGEKLYGPYKWDTYDIVVMPPSFPFGGMENPRMTFVTPCLLAGDKSLGDVIAHEIAHSWFGNLVTNANWSEFWLNEGFTMFSQRRITDEVHGKAFTALEAKTGRQILVDDVAEFGPTSNLTKLRCPIEEGVDPDDTYNECPYEKGFACVSYLASLVGEVPFDGWLKAYADKFAFTSIVAEDMFNFFFASFPHLKEKVDVDTWLHKPGMPDWLPDLSVGQQLIDPVDALLKDWKALGTNTDFAALLARASEVNAWEIYQRLYFLDGLLEAATSLPDGAVTRIGEEYGFLAMNNAEVRLRFGQCLVNTGVEAHFDYVRVFLESQGKQKYTLPLYRALLRRGGKARELAVATWRKTRATLHPNVRKCVGKVLEEVGESIDG